MYILHKMTTIVDAASKGHLARIIELLQSGADVNEQNKFGKTALMEAAWYKHTDIIAVLLAVKNINLDLQDNDWRTALLDAGFKKNKKIFDILVGQCANRNIADKFGNKF